MGGHDLEELISIGLIYFALWIFCNQDQKNDISLLRIIKILLSTSIFPLCYGTRAKNSWWNVPTGSSICRDNTYLRCDSYSSLEGHWRARLQSFYLARRLVLGLNKLERIATRTSRMLQAKVDYSIRRDSCCQKSTCYFYCCLVSIEGRHGMIPTTHCGVTKTLKRL